MPTGAQSSTEIEHRNKVERQLGQADLSGADLSGACLGAADLVEASLRGALLAGCMMQGAAMDHADLREATGEGVVLLCSLYGLLNLSRTHCVRRPPPPTSVLTTVLDEVGWMRR